MDNSPFSRLFELVNEEYKNEYGHAKKEFFLSMINAIKNLMEVNIMDKDKEISQLKNVLRQMPGNIYWKDKNGVYLGVNKILIKTLKNCNPEAWHDLKEEDLIGKTDYDLFPQDIADLYRQNDCAVMAAKQDLCCEEKFTLPNGQTMLLLSLKGPLIDEQGNVIGIIGNTIDITDFKKIEAELTEAKEKAEANTQLKTAFIKSMEQDIRTSCDGIYTITNHLYEQEAESKKKAFLEHVIKASKELLEYCKRLQ